MSITFDIPMDKMLPMALRSNNNKSAKSPPLRHDIPINSIYIYNYVLKKLQSKDYNEAYTILMQIKAIIRCVWKTYYNYIDYPDVNYLKHIYESHATKLLRPFMKPINITLKKFQTEFNSDDIIIIERSLIPFFKYDIKTFNDNSLWDKYLVIFDNILLSENIEVRKQIKNERDKKFRELDEEFADKQLYPKGKNEEEYKIQFAKIVADYRKQIDNNKEQFIFNVVNYLNWLYYNGTKEDKEFALKVILLRYCCFDCDTNFCEIYKQDKEYYKKFISKLFNNYISSDNLNDLLKLYLAINIYKYQYGHLNISLYDSEYVYLMINYSLNKLKTLDEYFADMLEEPNKYLNIMRLMFNDKYIIKGLLNKYFQNFDFKTRKIYDFIKERFDEKDIKELKVEEIYINISSKKNITMIFNKITENNKENMYEQLNKYNIKDVIEIFIDIYINNNSYGPYTYLALEYIINNVSRETQKYKNIETLNEIVYNSSANCSKELLGLLTVYFNDIRFYEYREKPNDKADIINTMMKYKQKITEEIKQRLIADINTNINNVKGYVKFLFENALSELQ